MADMIKFQQGLLSSLSSKDIANGTLWFTTDEGAIYLDTNGKRVRFGDYITVKNVNALPSAGHAYESALYYAKDENVLARWDSTNKKWVQLNAAGLSQIHVDGSGNVLSGVEVVTDATTGAKKLSFTTASVATSEALSGLNKTVSDLDAAYKAADTNLAKDIAAAKKAADDAQADADANAKAISDLDADLQGQIDCINTTIGSATSGMKKDIADLKAADTAIGTRIDGVESAYKAADTALRKELTGNTSGTGAATGTYKTINKLSEQVVAAESAISGLQGTVGGHTTDIAGMKTDIGNLQTAVGTGGTVDNKISTAVAALRKEILTDGTAKDNINDAYDTIKEISDWLGSSELGKDAGTIISELNTLSGTVGSASSGLVKDVADLKAADTTIRGEFANADTALKNLVVSGNAGTGTYKNINQLSEQMGAAEGDIDTLQSDLDQLEGVVGSASSGLVKDVADLKAADTTIRGEFAAADTALEKKLAAGTGGNSSFATGTYKNINALSTQVVAAESDIDTLQSDLDILEGTVGGHGTKLTQLEGLLTWGTF